MSKPIVLSAEHIPTASPAEPLTCVDLEDLQRLLAGWPLPVARRSFLHDRLQHYLDQVQPIKAAV